MPVYTDQTGRNIQLNKPPVRIISIVPSQTELLFHLSLADEVAGITKFCKHPDEWFRNKIKVGGTKQVKMDVIHQLKPDLIIANKEENVKEQVEELEKDYPVWVSDVNNLDDAYKMIWSIGDVTGKLPAAQRLISTIRFEFSQLEPSVHKLKTAYLIWKDPYMTVGGDTFIHSMLEAAGLENVFAGKTRYPEVSMDELEAIKPDLLLLSSEPYPFRQKHIDEWQQFLPATKIILADGEMFSWYGSRLQYAPSYFNTLRNQLK